ncbi:MAG TPA: hypothetical protein VHM19_08730, partial [Polyangiales bacterium]|nr:hypothetical protein [Polyangiales bacterium]
PHEADTVGELIVKIVTTKPPTMREIRADVPQVLSDCVAQAMAHDREERFVDATVFRRALLSAAEKAFSTQLRRPVGSEAPPRMAVGAVSPAPVPVALGASKPVAGLQLPPSAAVNTTPAGNAWGDFEGLDGRAAKVVSQAAQDPALAAAVAAAQANKAAAPPKPAAVPIPLLGNAPSASAAAPFDSGMLGASPFDSLGASMGSGALDLDFERGMNIGTGVSADGSMPRPPRSPVQRSAVKNQRENLYAGGTGQAARGTAGAKRVAIAAQPQRRKERSGWSPIWILPIVLLLGLGLFVLAPELVSEPGPDVHAARDAEAKNPATSGSERHLQSARRKDLKNKPPALRDVTF